MQAPDSNVPRDAPVPRSPVMIVAGDPSGDMLAAELVSALQALDTERRLRIFGAGGPRMAAAGVDVLVDMTQHSLIGLAEALARYRTFKGLFDRLLRLAHERRPDVIICVDFSGFNRRFARAVRTRAHEAHGWRPTIVQYVSPQVWASRPGRVRAMARDLDLLLAIFPFEPAWYATRAPGLRVAFVGHPVLDRYAAYAGSRTAESPAPVPAAPHIALLPGSRAGELRRHLPVMIAAARLIRTRIAAATFRLVAADAAQQPLIDAALAQVDGVQAQVGGLADVLGRADLALASTGTVTMECAYFGVPTVAIYRTSWLTYQIGKRIVTVPYIAMPNLIAGEAVFPELVQHDATPENVAAAAIALLENPSRRAAIRARLAEVVSSLGGPGASTRAAQAILDVLNGQNPCE